MQVILLQRIVNLGKLGDTVDVKSGYGRNYLVPQGKALPATAANNERFEARRAELEAVEAEELAAAQTRADALTDVNVIMRAKSGEDGKLFGSIGTRDISDALTKSGIEVDRAEVKLPEGTLRNIGEYNVDIQLHHDVFAKILVTILSEDGEAEAALAAKAKAKAAADAKIAANAEVASDAEADVEAPDATQAEEDSAL